jgi:hypothetical protein
MSDRIRGLSAQGHYRRGEEYLAAAHELASGPPVVEALLASQAHFAAATAQMAIYRDTQISKVPL